MKFRVQVVCVADDGAEQMQPVLEFERQALAMETLGMSLAEGKALLKGVQEFVAERQTVEFLQRAQACQRCGQQRSIKGNGSIPVRTVYGTVRLPNPRWRALPMSSSGDQDVPAATELATGADEPGAVVPGEQMGLIDSCSTANSKMCSGTVTRSSVPPHREPRLFSGLPFTGPAV